MRGSSDLFEESDRVEETCLVEEGWKKRPWGEGKEENDTQEKGRLMKSLRRASDEKNQRKVQHPTSWPIKEQCKGSITCQCNKLLLKIMMSFHSK